MLTVEEGGDGRGVGVTVTGHRCDVNDPLPLVEPCIKSINPVCRTVSVLVRKDF